MGFKLLGFSFLAFLNSWVGELINFYGNSSRMDDHLNITICHSIKNGSYLAMAIQTKINERL